MIYTTRDTCRLCDSERLTNVIDLGQQSLQGQFVLPTEPDPPSVPVVVIRCEDCGMVQQKHSVRGELQFQQYWYRSSISQTMRDHLGNLAAEAGSMIGPRSDCRILDIGGNDGALMNAWPHVAHRVVIDPSDVETTAAGVVRIQGFFPNDLLLCAKYDAVFSIACFYDTEIPVKFARAVAQVLKKDGLWCVEVADLKAIFDNADATFWCLEHTTAWTLGQLVQVGDAADLKLVRASRNTCNGGSIRAYFAHEKCNDFADVGWYAGCLEELGQDPHSLDLPTLCKSYAATVRMASDDLGAYLEDLKAEGKTAHWLAASTKANVLIQYAGITPDLVPYASDRDPRKVGRVMPGSRIPIISEAESRSLKPYAYISTLGGGFRDELYAREQEAGVAQELVFPLPSLARKPLFG